MTKLMQLGADSDYGGTLSETLRGNWPLSPEVKAAADRWAEEMYVSKFAGSPRLSERPERGCLPASISAE